MIKLSGVIITFNEEEKIKKCLTSLTGIVDEIVVVDSYSTDRTEEICKQFDVKFVKQKFLGYIEQKNFAISQASHDYIVSLDGDEALSTELQKSITALKTNWIHDGYYTNRYNYFCGQWIKYSDWYPDKKMRVFLKGKGEWKGTNPHDSYKLHKNGSQGKLNGDILHWNYLTYSDYNKKNEKFSTISAQSYYKLGKKASIWKIFFNPFWSFLKSYFLRLGFLDGFNGFVICALTANFTFLKYIKLRELHKKKRS